MMDDLDLERLLKSAGPRERPPPEVEQAVLMLMAGPLRFSLNATRVTAYSRSHAIMKA